VASIRRRICIPGQNRRLPGGRGAPARSDDEKPFYRAELHALSASINAALAKTSDQDTKAHLEGACDQIARILDPKFIPAAPAAPAGRGAVENVR